MNRDPVFPGVLIKQFSINTVINNQGHRLMMICIIFTVQTAAFRSQKTNEILNDHRKQFKARIGQ